MSEAVLKITADASGFAAGVNEAKRSANSLGVEVNKASSSASKSIDRYVKSLETQNKTMNMSGREAKLYSLAMRGASDAQLKAADSALKYAESQRQAAERMQKLSSAGKVVATALAAGVIASAVAFDKLIKSISEFQGVADKIGDTSANVASLAVAAGASGTAMETLVTASNTLTKALAGTEAGGEEARTALKALGVDIASFEKLGASERLDVIAKAMAGFKDGTEKTAAAMALFGKSGAELLPFLNDLGGEIGRQNILTQDQIALADEYAKKQDVLKAQLTLYAGAIAAEMLPAFNDLSKVLLELIKDFGGVNAETGKLDSSKIRAFADDAADYLAILLDTVRILKAAFVSLGTAIGSSLAAQSLVMQGEISKAMDVLAFGRKDISDIASGVISGSAQDKLMRERAARQRKEQEKLLLDAYGTGGDSRQKLDYSGQRKAASAKSDGSVKAQLDAELAEIKRNSQAQINALSNAEKIVQAKRSAGLITEKQYFDEKKKLLVANTKAQEAAFQAEINVLSNQKLSGKDQIENAKKIADAQANLAKVRADSAANLEVLALQEAGANKKIEQSYLDAVDAAKEYLETVKRRNELEVAGMGMGNRSREAQAGRNAIEDQFRTEKAKLDRDLRREQITREQYDKYVQVARDSYAKELALYTEYLQAKTNKEADWNAGATEAMRNYFDETQNIYKQMDSLVTNAFQNMEDALVDFVTTGKLDFKKLVDSIIADIARIQIRQSITGPLFNWLSGGSGGGGGGGFFSMFSSFFGGDIGSPAWDLNAKGGVYSSPSLSAYSGTIVNQPTPFRFAKGAGLMGEDGAEGIFPLTRGKDGKLGVKATGAGQKPMNITVNVNGSNNAPDVRRAAAQGAREALSAFNGAQRYA